MIKMKFVPYVRGKTPVADFFYQDVRIYVKTFIGCFQPTGNLSRGMLYGFAFSITVYF
jgi:hypothetical protein